MATPSTAIKFYSLKDPAKRKAMQELFPSVPIIENESEQLGFKATQEQAQLYRDAVDAHLDKVDNLEHIVGSNHGNALAPHPQELLSPTTKGLLYGLGVGVFTAAIVIFPIIPYAIQSGDYSSSRNVVSDIRNYQVLSAVMGGLVGGISGAALGFYASVRDRLSR